MSIMLMSRLFRIQFGSANRKMLAIRLADFADDDGCGIWPTVARLARETEISDRTVQRILKDMVEEGILIVVREGGGKPGQATRYDFNMQAIARLEAGENTAVNAVKTTENQTGDTVSPVTNPIERGDKSDIEGCHRVTQTIIKPLDKPSIERDACAKISEKENKKALEKSFWKIVRDWPQTDGMPKTGWQDAWCALTDEERLEAAAKRDSWIAHLKGMGRDHIPVPRTYFLEKLWKKIPVVEASVKDPASDRLEAKPCGKLFMARFYGYLFDGATEAVSLNKFELQLVDSGRYTAEHMLMVKQADQGFPAVNELISRAESRRGIVVSAQLQPLADRMVSIEVGSAVWQEWAEEHARRGWPWFNDNGMVKYVYLPEGGVTALNELQDLWLGVKNDSFK